MLALVALAGVRAVALWLPADMDGVDIASRPGHLKCLLRAFDCSGRRPLQHIEALTESSLIDGVEGLWCLWAKLPSPLLRCG